MTVVRVARGHDGTIRVSTGSLVYDDEGALGPDFTRAVLEVAGALLVWPVLGAPELPVAEVHDVGRAQGWLWAVYGEEVAVAVRAAQEGLPVRELTTPRTALADTAGRLAFGHWAARWWPASYTDGISELEDGVLGLELAALTHQCQELFDDFDNGVAELIEEHRAALDPLLRWWHATPQPAETASHLESVLRLIDEAADCAGLDGPELRRLRSALDEERGQGRTSAPVDLSALFARRDGYALAAGAAHAAGGRVIARGSGTNDWRRYPPGFVDAAEDAVSWTARAVGARRQIEVEVVAHAAAPVSGVPLVAEVRVDDGRPSRVPLARRDDMWTGRGDLNPGPYPDPTTPTPHTEVDVLLPGFDPGPGPDARTDRDAIRALARRRLAEAAQPRTHATQPFLAEILAATTDEDY